VRIASRVVAACRRRAGRGAGVLTKENRGSVHVIQRLLAGRPPAVPRIGFYIVDVRDLADLHIRAMIAPEAAGQRFIAAGDFMWMKDMAITLRSTLGATATTVPTRELPDFLVRFLALFIPQLRMLDAGPRPQVEPDVGESATHAGIFAAPGDHDGHRLRPKPDDRLGSATFHLSHHRWPVIKMNG
jgi:uncharacterized protein YbjT (DUF2867 family)